MDAKLFLKEFKRMCGKTTCQACPFIGSDCNVPNIHNSTDRAVDAVEAWSKAHPKVTNADKFKKIFGIELVSENVYDGGIFDDEKRIPLYDWLRAEYKEG